MIPWSLIDTAQIPGGAGTLRLKRRGCGIFDYAGR